MELNLYYLTDLPKESAPLFCDEYHCVLAIKELLHTLE